MATRARVLIFFPGVRSRSWPTSPRSWTWYGSRVPKHYPTPCVGFSTPAEPGEPMGIQRKPPVIAIRGTRHLPDVVTQQQLGELADLQAAERRLTRTVIEKALSIERRIQEGAKVEPGSLGFDQSLTLARSQQVRVG